MNGLGHFEPIGERPCDDVGHSGRDPGADQGCDTCVPRRAIQAQQHIGRLDVVTEVDVVAASVDRGFEHRTTGQVVGACRVHDEVGISEHLVQMTGFEHVHLHRHHIGPQLGGEA